MALFKEIKIAGTGSCAPAKVVTSEELAARLGTNVDWIYSNLGIVERRIAAQDEYSSDLGSQAAKAAIDSAALSPNDIVGELHLSSRRELALCQEIRAVFRSRGAGVLRLSHPLHILTRQELAAQKPKPDLVAYLGKLHGDLDRVGIRCLAYQVYHLTHDRS
jgi:hypothetical protein